MSENERKLFGTDGIRGVANQFPMTVEVAMRLGRAVAERFRHAGRPGRIVIGKDTRLDDGEGRYVQYLKDTFPRDRTLDGIRVVVDCANGAAYRTAPMVLEELGAEVFPLGVAPNGQNINDA